MFDYDIDEIMGSVRDENKLQKIEVIPNIVDSSGRHTETFKQFYNLLTDAVFEQDWKKVYKLSDSAMSEDTFIKMIDAQWGNFYKDFNTTPSAQKGFCTDINPIRFKQLHGGILGSILVITYMIKSNSDSLTDRGMKLFRHSTEVWFTYKNNKFCVVSAIQPFVEVRD